jgi:cell division protein FtsX
MAYQFKLVFVVFVVKGAALACSLVWMQQALTNYHTQVGDQHVTHSINLKLEYVYMLGWVGGIGDRWYW